MRVTEQSSKSKTAIVESMVATHLAQTAKFSAASNQYVSGEALKDLFINNTENGKNQHEIR
jgi:hypothetical protein